MVTIIIFMSRVVTGCCCHCSALPVCVAQVVDPSVLQHHALLGCRSWG